MKTFNQKAMDNHIQKSETKPLESFSLKNREQFPQIRAVNEPETIKQRIRIAFVLTGLKPDNTPSEKYADILFNFVVENYSDLHVEEITTAFNLLLQRKLDIQENQISHYQEFSCEYFGRVMNAYRKYRNKELKKIIDSKGSELKTINMSNHAYLKSALFDKYDKIVNGMSYLSQFSSIDAVFLYNKLENIGFEISTKEERQLIWDELKLNVDWYKPKTAQQRREQPNPTNLDAEKELKHRLFKEWIQSSVLDEVNIMSLITLKLRD